MDIERALKNDYSKDARKRDLQLEAKAHIAVQKWIDGGGITGRAVTSDGIREIHRRFCEELPEDLLWVEDSVTKERVWVVPGALRTRDVRVADQIAISPGAVPSAAGRTRRSGARARDAIALHALFTDTPDGETMLPFTLTPSP